MALLGAFSDTPISQIKLVIYLYIYLCIFMYDFAVQILYYPWYAHYIRFSKVSLTHQVRSSTLQRLVFLNAGGKKHPHDIEIVGDMGDMGNINGRSPGS